VCLIVYKPAGIPIPAELLRAATALNPDGWGLMGLRENGSLILERRLRTDIDQLCGIERSLRPHSYCLHLRRQTRGSSAIDNSHPLRVAEHLFLMHNGTLHIDARVPGRSDSWHLAVDLLRPLASRMPLLFTDPGFVELMELGLGPENKLALLDVQRRAFVLVNRRHGAELEGLWLSSTRWIDRRLLPLAGAPQIQQRTYDPGELAFV
jgi:hypothetical protein